MISMLKQHMNTKIKNPNIEAEIVGSDTNDCGVELFDESGNRHVVTVGWDGEII